MTPNEKEFAIVNKALTARMLFNGGETIDDIAKAMKSSTSKVRQWIKLTNGGFMPNAPCTNDIA